MFSTYIIHIGCCSLDHSTFIIILLLLLPQTAVLPRQVVRLPQRP